MKACQHLCAYACEQKLRKQYKTHHALRYFQTRAGAVTDLVLHTVLNLSLRLMGNHKYMPLTMHGAAS